MTESTERFYGQDETDELLTIAEATPQDDGSVSLEVVQIEKDDEPYHHGWWKVRNEAAEMEWVCARTCPHPDHDEEGG